MEGQQQLFVPLPSGPFDAERPYGGPGLASQLLYRADDVGGGKLELDQALDEAQDGQYAKPADERSS